MIVKKVFKFATGEVIPDGAVYLNTVKQEQLIEEESGMVDEVKVTPCWLVWHYFLVEVEIKEQIVKIVYPKRTVDALPKPVKRFTLGEAVKAMENNRKTITITSQLESVTLRADDNNNWYAEIIK